ncbi:MAG: hypothetical protein V9G04_14100 [Nocardioides sp.]|jgi:hypothetical protein
MTHELSPEDEAYLIASCEASGVPVKITDPDLLDRLAALLRPPG